MNIVTILFGGWLFTKTWVISIVFLNLFLVEQDSPGVRMGCIERPRYGCLRSDVVNLTCKSLVTVIKVIIQISKLASLTSSSQLEQNKALFEIMLRNAKKLSKS